MKELMLAVGLLVFLAGWGIFQKQFNQWAMEDECQQLLLYLDTGRDDEAWRYLATEATALKADTPDTARAVCDAGF